MKQSLFAKDARMPKYLAKATQEIADGWMKAYGFNGLGKPVLLEKGL
jgi:hypothetical protein